MLLTVTMCWEKSNLPLTCSTSNPISSWIYQEKNILAIDFFPWKFSSYVSFMKLSHQFLLRHSMSHGFFVCSLGLDFTVEWVLLTVFTQPGRRIIQRRISSWYDDSVLKVLLCWCGSFALVTPRRDHDCYWKISSLWNQKEKCLGKVL